MAIGSREKGILIIIFSPRAQRPLWPQGIHFLVLGQLYVGPNSLWAPFDTVIVQLMYCLVLCCGFAGIHRKHFGGSLPHQDVHAKIATANIICQLLN